MPKAQRQRIRPRGQIEVPGGAGTIGVPAATRAKTDGGHGGEYVGKNYNTGLIAFSSVLSEMAKQANIAQAKREAEEERARNKAERAAEKAAEKAEAERQRQLDSIDRISAAAVGNSYLSEVDQKTRTGEWGMEDARNAALDLLNEQSTSSAFSGAFEAYAIKGIAAAEQRAYAKAQEDLNSSYLAVTRQAFHDLHSTYNIDDPASYATARNEIFASRHDLGVSGQDINQLEIASLAEQTRRLSTDDPARALALLDLAEQVRPDGSPSLAASLPGGYEALGALRIEINKSIVAQAATESKEADAAMKESAKDNYADALISLTGLDSPEKVKQWESENIGNKTNEEMKRDYGDYRDELVKAVAMRKSNAVPEGNSDALAEWTMEINRGTADWDRLNRDDRLTPINKANFNSQMRDQTQRANLGHIPDSTLAVQLLTELEAAWPASDYASPWAGSVHNDPGKPPVVTPEGLYYQNELLKRVREVDPSLDPMASNLRKQGILQDVKNDILSRRVRWSDHAERLGEPAPVLKLSAKVKDGERLTGAEVTALGRLMHQGGNDRVREAAGISYFDLDGQDQKAVAAEAQRLKVELEALKADGFWVTVTAPKTYQDALAGYNDVMVQIHQPYGMDPARLAAESGGPVETPPEVNAIVDDAAKAYESFDPNNPNTPAPSALIGQGGKSGADNVQQLEARLSALQLHAREKK